MSEVLTHECRGCRLPKVLAEVITGLSVFGSHFPHCGWPHGEIGCGCGRKLLAFRLRAVGEEGPSHPQLRLAGQPVLHNYRGPPKLGKGRSVKQRSGPLHLKFLGKQGHGAPHAWPVLFALWPHRASIAHGFRLQHFGADLTLPLQKQGLRQSQALHGSISHRNSTL